jgi:hypothetical protein
MEPEGSLSSSQEPATGSCPELDESSRQPIVKIHQNQAVNTALLTLQTEELKVNWFTIFLSAEVCVLK